MNHHNDRARAKNRVNARLGFYIHLAAYLLVNLLLVVINLWTSSDRLWFQWPLLGWGIGIVAHGLAVFGLPGLPGVRNRMIENEIRKGT